MSLSSIGIVRSSIMKNSLSFSSLVKEEICSFHFESIDRKKALLSAYIRINGYLSISNKTTILVLKTTNAKIAKFIYSLLKEVFPNFKGHFDYLKISSSSIKTTYCLTVDSDSDEIINGLSIDYLEGKIPRDIVFNDNTISGYLTGSFLATGSINSPTTSNYHLEICLYSLNYASWMVKLFKKYRNSTLTPKICSRRDKYVVYLKRGDQIAEFLSLIGATNSCLEYENARVNRDFLNSANRLENLDTANMKKVYEASLKQIQQIQFIKKIIGIKHLRNKKLALFCLVRLENETASLNEIASLMSEELGYEITKSNVNHLARSLNELCRKYNYEDSDN